MRGTNLTAQGGTEGCGFPIDVTEADLLVSTASVSEGEVSIGPAGTNSIAATVTYSESLTGPTAVNTLLATLGFADVRARNNGSGSVHLIIDRVIPNP